MIRKFAIILFVLSASISQVIGADTPPTEWLADGSKIVVAAKLAEGQGLYILDPEGRRDGYIPFAHEILAVKWPHKDEAMCLLARQSDGRCYLWLANPTGIIARLSNRSVYIGDTPSADLFDCSPDGRYIVFPSGSGANVDLWRADTEGRTEKQLTNAKGRDLSPAWSPNGRLIAFESERGGTRGIWVMSPDGGSVRRVADGPDAERCPTWSPASDSLAYLVKGKSEGIYVSPVSGGKSKPIAIGGKGYAAPVWSSTGKWIAFIYGKSPANIYCTPIEKAKGWGPYYQTTFDRSKDTRTHLRAPNWSPACDQLVFTTFEDGKMSIRLANMSTSYGAVYREVYTATGAGPAGKSGGRDK